MEHQLKTWPEYFEPVRTGDKTVELRRNDRNYQVGDTLLLREWEPMACAYTGREVHVHVTHVIHGGEWLAPSYVAMSIRR